MEFYFLHERLTVCTQNNGRKVSINMNHSVYECPEEDVRSDSTAQSAGQYWKSRSEVFVPVLARLHDDQEPQKGHCNEVEGKSIQAGQTKDSSSATSKS